MKKTSKYATVFILLFSVIFMYGCQNINSKKYATCSIFYSLSELTEKFDTYAKSRIDSQSSEDPLPGSSASPNNTGENKDIMGTMTETIWFLSINIILFLRITIRRIWLQWTALFQPIRGFTLRKTHMMPISKC